MNRLGDALSPYLQQHANNPVDWWPWGEEALAEAKRRDVPLFISVGYAACHWCHVMAHESFEDPAVAEIINEHMVAVKVDREERPDIDAVYMQATMALTGQGGWPMTVFAMPDGTPFFAGTYFPREHFVRLLEAVNDAWTDRREELMSQGAAVVQACASAGPKLADVTRACPIDGPCPDVSPVPVTTLDAAAATIVGTYDRKNGGFGSAPKFPTQPALAFLLDHYDRTGDDQSLAIVRHTAERMARGGIYDQLGGGFARYSVDESWVVPHFEKMLYDNALLLQTYTDLWELTRQPFFARIAEETARFIVDDLGTAEGGFAAAFDADTGGVEGATYAWTPQQLRDTLGEEDGDHAAHIFAVSDAGTFEHGTSVLQLPVEPADTDRYRDIKRRLLHARSERPQPDRDDKVVAAWNGLAVLALTEYAAETGHEWADEAAGRAAELLAHRHVVDGRIRRVSRDGRVGEAVGILEDYAAVALGFMARFEATDDRDWLDRAGVLIDVIMEHFGDGAGGFFDTAGDAEALVNRPADPTDGPTPSGWALAARALSEYSDLTDGDEYEDAAWRALAAVEPVISSHARFAAGVAGAAELMLMEDE
ncbi:hypothetical protein FB566_1505 [Stackebrandtia endophytica]|uniref:Spermatogenesis-associated protein 20-like TRX domain-containing protein n=1 Tax=Stackebrandtia endophytica TaxID=1496996 RepID=A0A543ATZ2_9ACTN|nr:thioredoxin domain-containing protein [Stackebrandtia endophytica]TQL75985.1 hypothetical protein FB566_1505 [Stackebrandtia endophytica]